MAAAITWLNGLWPKTHRPLQAGRQSGDGAVARAKFCWRHPAATATARPRVVAASAGAGSDWERVSLPRFALYGSLGGIGLECFMYPVFALVARLQFERKANVTLFSGAVKMVKKTPIRQFYRGFTLYAIAGLPSLGIFYASYNQLKQHLAPLLPPPIAYSTSAVLADTICVPFFSPVEMMAKRIQVQGDSNQSYGSIRTAFKHILQTEGWQGMFRGMGALLATMAPYSAVWWTTYEHVKPGIYDRVYPRDEHGQRPASTPLAPFIFAFGGAIAGMVAAVFTNPLCVATTRLQTQHTLLEPGAVGADGTATVAQVKMDRNVLQAMRTIVVNEGAIALGRGLLPRIAQCMFASAITFPMYEAVMHLSTVDD